MSVGNSEIESKSTINILGIRFDENLKWQSQIENAISESNKVLYAIKQIKDYFTLNERKMLITSLYFPKLYYGSEIWHLPELAAPLKKSLKRSSAMALKICITDHNQYSTHTEIHQKAKRSPPEQMCLYKHALLLYSLFNSCIPELEHLHLNFQLVNNDRKIFLEFKKSLNFGVGKNILLNRFTHLNNLIEKDWLNLSFDSYKVKCKTIFLIDH